MNSAFNEFLLESLKELSGVLQNSPLRIEEDSVSLLSGDLKIATITSTDILVGETSYQKVMNKTGKSTEAQHGFFREIGNRIIRLNHLGISYFTEDMDEDIEKLKYTARQLNAHAYEEISNDPSWRWFFVGNKDNWQNALFEIVLNKGKQPPDDFWRPHFQIDIDTSMTIDEIKEITDKYFGKGFIKWQLDFPDYGTVLAMGRLGQINGSKIVLGIGTTLRGTEYHRKNQLKPLSK